MARGDWPGITGLNEVPPGVAARAYAAAGIPVFQLHGVTEVDGQRACTCHEGLQCKKPGKHPLKRGWRESATTDVDTVQAWWEETPWANIGMPTGAVSSFISVDLDTRTVVEGDEEIEVDGEAEFTAWMETKFGSQGWQVDTLGTLVQQTGGGGKQLIMRDSEADQLRSLVDWLPGVDIRGRGGLIVLPPSSHVSGEHYQWITQNAPAVIPPLLRGTLLFAHGGREGRSGQSHTSRTATSGYAYADIVERLKTEGVGPSEGMRDDFFNDHLFQRCKQGMSKEDARGEIRRIWEVTPGCGQPGEKTYNWQAVVEKLDRIWNDVQPDEGVPDSVVTVLSGWRSTTSDNGQQPAGSSAGGGDGPTGTDGPPSPILSDEYDFAAQLNETGYAERWVRRYRGTYIYVGEMKTWNGWDGNRLAPVQGGPLHSTREIIRELAAEQATHENDDDTTVRDAYRNAVRHMSTRAGRSNVLALAAVHPDIERWVSWLDADPMLLVVQNGTLDLEKIELRESRVSDLNTKCAGVKYDPKAQCPYWTEHVKTITSRRDGTPDPELAAYLQRWAGYTLTGLVDEQKFAFLFGGGNNGKNVFIEALMKVLGDYAAFGSVKLLTGSGQEHETVLTDLVGHRLVFVDETPRGKVNEARLKQLTGTGRIRARKIAQDSFEFDARFKLWIAGNNKPRISETSEGMWRRLALVSCDAIIAPDRRIRNYAAILTRDEGSGILNWALEGLRAYQEIGLAPPTRVVDATQEYREEEDQLGRFIEETFIQGGQETWHPNKVILSLYQQWCRDQGVEHPPTLRSIQTDLKRHGFRPDDRPRRISWSWRGGSKTERGHWGPPLGSQLPMELTWSA